MKRAVGTFSSSWARLLFIFGVGLFLQVQQADAANESPQTFTLDGKLFKTGTLNPLVDSSIKLKIQILNPAKTCVLYEEEQTVSTILTQGYFNIQVGSSTGSSKRTSDDPGSTMTLVFQNTSPIPATAAPYQVCGGSSYSPAAGDVRYFRIAVTPSSTNLEDVLSPDMMLNSVPQALVAQSVQGLDQSDLLQVKNSGSTVLTQANLEAAFTTPAYTNLQSILAGSFIKTDSTGANLPSFAANPTGLGAGDLWYDTTSNSLKYYNGTAVQTLGTSGSGISSLTVGSSLSADGTVGGTLNAAGTIDLSNTGVAAGAYAKVTVDIKGRVTGGASLDNTDIPTLTTAGKVSGNSIITGTISGDTSISTTGNLVSSGTVSGQTVQATQLRIYNGTNYVQMVTPALGGNVLLTLPTTDGNNGEFLKTDGSGVLSWASPSTVTSTDITTALGFTPLSASSNFSGDVSGTSTITSVDRIKGKAVTAATAANQIMIYDGTSWVNSTVSGDATLANSGILTLNTVAVSKGGTGSTSFTANSLVMANGTGSALVSLACSQNQLVSFDASGVAGCYNAGAVLGGTNFAQGGNAFGSNASLGTTDTRPLAFITNNATRMVISQDGSVGIGTASPDAKLDVVGNSEFNGHIFQGGGSIMLADTNGVVKNNNGTAGSNLSIIGGASTSGFLNLQSTESAGGTDYIKFTVGNNGATEAMRVVTSGNIGIGTNSPGSGTKLSVEGQIRTKSYSQATGALDWANGNTITTSYDCGAQLTHANIRDGGNYTLVVTGTGTTQCDFSTTTTGDDAATVSYRFNPPNTTRASSSHTIYSLLRVGNIVYVSWIGGF